MAIQPIQLANGLGTAKGMEHFGEALDDYTKFKDQQRTQSRMEEQQKSEMLHRRRMEYGQAFAQAQQYIKAGDLQSAQAVLAPFVNGFETADSPLGQEQQPGAAPPQAHGGSAVPDQVDQGRSVAGGPAAFQPSPPLQQANAYAQLTPSTDDPDVVAAQAGKPKTYRAPYDPLFDPTKDMPPSPPGLGPSDQGTAAPPEEAPTNPIMAARAQERATEQRRAQKLLRYADPFTGQQVTLDPAEAEQSRRDQMARQGGENERVLHQSFDDLVKTDPFVAEQFPRILATYKAAGVPVDPKQVLGELMASQRQAEQDKRVAQQLGFRGEQGDLNRVVRREGIAATKENAHTAGRARTDAATIMAAGGRPGDTTVYNPKIEAGNRATLANAHAAVKEWEHSSGYDKIHYANIELDKLRKLANSNIPADQAHAIEKLSSIAKGGNATMASLDLIQHHLSGKAGEIDTWRNKVLGGGQQGTEALANLRGSVNTLIGATREELAKNRNGFMQQFYSPEYYPLKGNIDDIHAGLYGDVGYPTERKPEAPTIVPGSGQRPGQRPQQPAAPPGAKSVQSYVDEVFKPSGTRR